MGYEYFVMLNHPSLGIMPLVDDNDSIVVFTDEDDARAEAQANGLGDAYGYEIFRRGEGII